MIVVAPHAHRVVGHEEYYAGGIDDEGHGSGTVLLYPKTENTTSTDAAEGNATTAEAGEAEEPPATFKGSARSLG